MHSRGPACALALVVPLTTRSKRAHFSVSCALLASAIALRSNRSDAQDPGVSQSYQTWLGVFGQGRIYDRLFFQGDVQYRGYDNMSPLAILVRPGVAIQIVPGMLATVGYAWTPFWTAPNANGFTDEHRAWQQWQYDIPLREGALTLQLRSRLEERVRPDVSDEVGVRFRQMVRVSIPFTRDRRWIVALWDEVFFGLNNTTWKQHAGFDQNRAFAGVGFWIVPRGLRVEAGYFNHYVYRPGNPDGDRLVHAAMVNTFIVWQ